MSDKDVPSAVIDAFKLKYPNSVAKKWSKEDGGYEVSTEINQMAYDVAFDKTGAWLETERTIKYNDLPDAVKDALSKSAYGSWETKEVTEFESPEHPFLSEIEVSNGKEKASVHFSKDGNLVKEKKSKGEEEDDDDDDD